MSKFSIPCEYCDIDTQATQTLPIAINPDDYVEIPVCEDHYKRFSWEVPDIDVEALSDEYKLELA